MQVCNLNINTRVHHTKMTNNAKTLSILIITVKINGSSTYYQKYKHLEEYDIVF